MIYTLGVIGLFIVGILTEEYLATSMAILTVGVIMLIGLKGGKK